MGPGFLRTAAKLVAIAVTASILCRIRTGTETAAAAKMTKAMTPPISVPLARSSSPFQVKKRSLKKRSSGGNCALMPLISAKSSIAIRTQAR